MIRSNVSSAQKGEHPRGSTTAANGRSKRPRRKRSKKKHNQVVLSVLMITIGLMIVGIMITMKSMPHPRQLHHQPATSSDAVPLAQPKSNAHYNWTLINNDLDQTEQHILEEAKEELNRFPRSVGIDLENNNPEWEWILHPGTEAQKYMHGESFTSKRKSVRDVTNMLLRKKHAPSDIDQQSDETQPSAENGYMRVPKLWDAEPFREISDLRKQLDPSLSTTDGEGVRRYLGNYGERLMTTIEAKSIGSRIKDGEGNELETIFVTVASYRDWQCSSTVESAFSRATHPERIRVGVVDQIDEKDKPCSVPPGGSCDDNPDQATCRHRDQVDYLTVDASLSVGPVFARHLGHRLYRGEYFAMQSDAHITFVKGWDDEIIEQWHSANNEMAVLSTYLSGVEDHINEKTGERTSKSRPIMCDSDFEGAGGDKHLRHGQQPEGVPYIHNTPMLNPYWAAGFSFGRGHFVVNVPYDQHLPWIFQGEEISIGLRGFSYGYDYYAAEKSVCYHYYGRKGIPMFWENTNKYRGVGDLGMTRLNAIIHMLPSQLSGKAWIKDDTLKYGIGKVRDVKQFFDTFGIHVDSQTVEHNLCKFVGRPMQKKFIPFLRSNGMGLDYDKIGFRWKEGMNPTWD